VPAALAWLKPAGRLISLLKPHYELAHVLGRRPDKPLDADQARSARGPHGDPTAFMLLRPGVGPGAVVVEVTDPQDPHRTWLVASRHPARLARAIETARGRLSP
jgi:hypothetical protein